MINPAKGENGVALVFVLWVLILLTVIVAGFSQSVRTSINGAFYKGLEAKAFYIAQAGIEVALKDILGQKKIDGIRKWRMNADNPVVNFGDGTFEISISNQGGIINLNKAGDDLLRMFLGQVELEDKQKDIIIDSILDWRDSDSMHRLNGAENDYYGSLPEPYQCRNGDFISVGELMKVRGITHDVYYNAFKGLVCVDRDENLLRPKRSSIQEYLQLENRSSQNSIQTFLTVEKRDEMNRIGKPYNYLKININAASPSMLLVLPGMTEALVEKIFKFRRDKDIETLSDLKKLTGAEVFSKIERYVSLQESRYYTITSIGRVSGSDVQQKIDLEIWLDNEKYTKYYVMQKNVNKYDFFSENNLLMSGS